MSDQMDDLTGNLQNLFHFSETPSRSRTTLLRSTINVGAEYSVAQNRVGFGLLSSTRIYKPKIYTELTASVEFIVPIDWFAATVSYSFVHSAFKTFGFALNFSPSWINFLCRQRLYVYQGESAVHSDQSFRGQSVLRAQRSAPERTAMSAVIEFLRT